MSIVWLGGVTEAPLIIGKPIAGKPCHLVCRSTEGYLTLHINNGTFAVSGKQFISFQLKKTHYLTVELTPEHPGNIDVAAVLSSTEKRETLANASEKF